MLSLSRQITQISLCAGFYPSILRVDHPPKVYRKVLAGAMETDASPARLSSLTAQRVSAPLKRYFLDLSRQYLHLPESLVVLNARTPQW